MTCRMKGQNEEVILLQEYCMRGDVYAMIDRDALNERDMRRVFGNLVCFFA